jgi:ERCC4-type nuclease
MKRNAITVPFTVVIDTRETAPYHFAGLKADAKDKGVPLLIPTVEAGLKTGDYAIEGMENMATVERKSLADLYSTLGQNRERFEREHERMAEMKRAIVMIEASWYEILKWPPPHSSLNPKTVFRTALSWHARYGVAWIAADSRRFAEIYTFRWLEKIWKEFHDG